MHITVFGSTGNVGSRMVTGRGCPTGRCLVLAGIIHILKSGIPWRMPPL